MTDKVDDKLKKIALWCNGSTSDSGSACESSNLSKATRKKSLKNIFQALFACYTLSGGTSVYEAEKKERVSHDSLSLHSSHYAYIACLFLMLFYI